ncbi:MAG: hypothetical protein EZS28_008112 [Streblomastix strix]|uniref:Uncharacterized protein n=1 Tax=Streblomastix strix TaxID=222440 RepID=A0A5J4WP52_9EUKA|nr:MAG: hypothetical protein EZS28_008112 [Streblomastix strix]
MAKVQFRYKTQSEDTPEAKPSQLQIGQSFGRSLTQIQNQILQDYNLLYRTQKINAKEKIKVLHFGIIQERDTDRMIDQIQRLITRIFSLVPATTSNTVDPDLSQRQIGCPTLQLVKTPDTRKLNKNPAPKQQSNQSTLLQRTPGQLQPSNQQQQITIRPQPQIYQLSTQSSISTSQSSETTSSNIIPTTSDGHIVLTALLQLWTVSLHAGGETANVFKAQRAIIQQFNDGNEMIQLQKGHQAAQGADGLGFQPLMGPEQEQSEDEPEKDKGYLDINNFSDIQDKEGSSGHTQETRRGDANKCCNKTRPNLPRKKKRSRQLRQLYLRTAHTDVGLETLTGGATTSDSSQEKLKPKNQTEIKAYKATLQDELQEAIIEKIPKEQVKGAIQPFWFLDLLKQIQLSKLIITTTKIGQ